MVRNEDENDRGVVRLAFSGRQSTGFDGSGGVGGGVDGAAQTDFFRGLLTVRTS